MAKAHKLKCICRRQAWTWPSVPNKKGAKNNNAICWYWSDLALFCLPRKHVSASVGTQQKTTNNKSRYPQFPRLWGFGNIIQKCPEVSSLCVLLWKWRRAYNRAVERPLVSIGWIRRTENLRKKCKLKSDAKHGSRGDLVRELHGGFLVQPREASSWSRGVPVLHSPGSRCNQTNGDLTFKDGA